MRSRFHRTRSTCSILLLAPQRFRQPLTIIPHGCRIVQMLRRKRHQGSAAKGESWKDRLRYFLAPPGSAMYWVLAPMALVALHHPQCRIVRDLGKRNPVDIYQRNSEECTVEEGRISQLFADMVT